MSLMGVCFDVESVSAVSLSFIALFLVLLIFFILLVHLHQAPRRPLCGHVERRQEARGA